VPDPQQPARDPLPAAAPEPLELVQRRTMRVLVIMQIIGTVGVGVAPSIGVLLAGEVTQNEAWAGLARTASTLGAALLGLPLGNLAARRGRRVALASGWWTAAAGAAILVAAAQWSLVVPLFIGLLLIGAGSAVSLQARFAATDLAEPHHKGRSLALVVWVGTIGSVLGPNLGVPGEILHRATGLSVFAGAFIVAAVCLGLAGVIVFLRLRPDPLLILQASAASAASAPARSPALSPALSAVHSPVEPAGKKRAPVRRILAELRTNRPARFAMIAILSAQVVMVSIMTMTPVHIAHQGGSISIIGITISLHIAGMYALAPLVGFIVDRYGHRPSIGAGLLIFLASASIGASRPSDTGWIMVSLFLLGVGWSFVNVAGSALFSRVVSAETRASSQGGVDALANLCGAVAAFAAGPLLAASSFPVLSVLATAVLLPLAVLTVRRRSSAAA
jgi:MFS family permease